MVVANEFIRLDARFLPGSGVCALRLGGGILTDVCCAYDVELMAAHRAPGDARATAQVLACLVEQMDRACSAAHVFDIGARTDFLKAQPGSPVPAVAIS